MKRTYKNLAVARQMPRLRHSIPGEPFDIEDSEVVKWLIKQPEIMQYVFGSVEVPGRDLIEYDPETGTWAGVDR